MKWSKAKLFFFLFSLFLIGGCGKKEEGMCIGTPTMGRYVEEAMDIYMDEFYPYTDLVQDDKHVRLVSPRGEDLLSADKGESFSSGHISDLFKGTIEAGSNVMQMSTTPAGDKLIYEYGGKCYLINKEEQVIEMEIFCKKESPTFACGKDGFFYVCQEGKVYQVDPKSGDSLFLLEVSSFITYMASNGRQLYLVDVEKIQIYDIEKRQLLEQDATLQHFLVGKFSDFNGTSSFLLYPVPEEDSLYILTEEGLYHQVIYEDSIEQIMEGSLYSIGDLKKDFISMEVTREGEYDSFLILYSNNQLMRYTYDNAIPTVPETVLRIYGVYEDGNVKQAVSDYQFKHPELYVSYEVAITGNNGMTLDDALKNLTTELAAGKGPDILLMDNIPYESYVKKDVLMDISSIFAEMEGSFFDSIIDSFKIDNKLYTMPVAFSIPVIGGEYSKIKGLEALADLALLLEEARLENPEGAIFNNTTPSQTINLLAQTSQGAWIKGNGSLDREAITEFLTQSEKIYKAQMAGITDDYLNMNISVTEWGLGKNVLINRFPTGGAYHSSLGALHPGQTYFADYLNGSMTEFAFYLAVLKRLDCDYIVMPGLQQDSCLPVTLISINNASQMKEEATDFFQYILSSDFQCAASLNGAPINKTAYYTKQLNPYPDRPTGVPYTYVGYGNDEFSTSIEVFWPTEDEFAKLNEMVEGMKVVSRCEDRIYDAVSEFGEKALAGEMSVEEAVNAIENRVQIYLAE